MSKLLKMAVIPIDKIANIYTFCGKHLPDYGFVLHYIFYVLFKVEPLTCISEDDEIIGSIKIFNVYVMLSF